MSRATQKYSQKLTPTRLCQGDDDDDAGADAIIGKVLAYLSHKRREELYPSWTTEERDVVLAALQVTVMSMLQCLGMRFFAQTVSRVSRLWS
jgi:hypothetical protein